MSTHQRKEKRKKYPSDISKNGWKKLKAYLPQSKCGEGKVGRTAANLREVINAIMYVVKSGCSWRSIPNDLPNWSTTYGYFYRWSKEGRWQEIHSFLVKKVRKQMGRKARPTAGCLDSQSSKTTACGGKSRGFDKGKLIKGRKRFILTDSQGLLLAVWICAASVSEKQGAMHLLRYIKAVACLRHLCERIKLVWVDGGYRGADLADYVAKLWQWTWQVVLRNDDQRGFRLLPRRWVVERTFAWLLNARRLNKDYEKSRRNSQSMVYLAFMPILLNRLH